MTAIILTIHGKQVEVKVGGEIGYGRGGYDHTQKVMKVARITPGGQVITECGNRFNKDGRELGRSEYSTGYLMSADVVRERKAAREQENERCAKAKKLEAFAANVVRWSREAPTAEQKAEMIALIESL